MSKYLGKGFFLFFLLLSLGVSVYLAGRAVNIWPQAGSGDPEEARLRIRQQIEEPSRYKAHVLRGVDGIGDISLEKIRLVGLVFWPSNVEQRQQEANMAMEEILPEVARFWRQALDNKTQISTQLIQEGFTGTKKGNEYRYDEIYAEIQQQLPQKISDQSLLDKANTILDASRGELLQDSDEYLVLVIIIAKNESGYELQGGSETDMGEDFNYAGSGVLGVSSNPVSVNDLFNWREKQIDNLVAHETGHALSFPDQYQTGTGNNEWYDPDPQNIMGSNMWGMELMEMRFAESVKKWILNQRVDTASTDTSYDLGVLVIKYFPLTPNGLNIDLSVTGDVGEPYSFIRQRTIDITDNLKTSLERSSTYLGYKDTTAQPALRYTIVDSKEYLQAVPIKPNGVRVTYPDYNKIMTEHDICNYVDNKNVREVWLWAYQGPNKQETNQPSLGIDESKMSSPYGDISNSWRFADMPVCRFTYRVYTFNYGRGTAEAIESWGHQLEAEMDAIDWDLFRGEFQGPNYPPVLGVPGRCGSVHNPPNSREEYDRGNRTPHESDCLDWNPEGQGALSQISCANWGCDGKTNTDNPHLNAQIWVMQNMPGRNNTKHYQGNKLRNWWDVHGDFDTVMSKSRTLFVMAVPSPTPSPLGASPTPTAVPSPSLLPESSFFPTPTPTPTAFPTPPPHTDPLKGDINNDNSLDILDYNIVVSHFGSKKPDGPTPADLDKDGDVDIFDYNLMIGYFVCRNGCG